MQAKLDQIIDKIQARYDAARPSRFSRERTGLGGTGDAHTLGTLDLWRIRETSRDQERNDKLIGQMVERAVNNIIGDGPTPIPQTGSPELDERIKQNWSEWAKDPSRVDTAKTWDFHGLVCLWLRQMFVDGDIFIRPAGESMQTLEADWIDSGLGSRNTIHGVELSPVRAPVAYHLRMPTLADNWLKGFGGASSPAQILPAFDSAGNRLVFHLAKPNRYSTTRGMPALTPAIEAMGMIDDIQFAKLIQLQMSACIGLIVTRDPKERTYLGARELVTDPLGGQVNQEHIEPGGTLYFKQGESVSTLNPNVNATEFAEFMRFLLRMVGGNLGLPLSISMLDASQTNFHGYRGEIDQAKKDFAKNQRVLESRALVPLYSHLVRWWAAVEGWPIPAGARLTRHKWAHAAFPYINPMQDIQADALALEHLMVSPRDLCAERGRNWDEIVEETIADRVMAIESAAEALAALQSRYPSLEGLTWRDVINMPSPKGTTTASSTAT